MKSSAFVTDTLVDPATSHSEDSSGSPCLRLFEPSYYDYLYAPGNEYRSARFHVAMANLASSERSTVVPGGFPWESLVEGTKIVDVGGGIGSACHEIMKTNPLLNFVVQDLPSVADQAVVVSTPLSMFVSGVHNNDVHAVLEPPRAQSNRGRPSHDTGSRFLLSSACARRRHLPA